MTTSAVAVDHHGQGERRRNRQTLGDIINQDYHHHLPNKPFTTKAMPFNSPSSIASKDHQDSDKNNEDEIYLFYKLSETKGCFKDYMNSQPFINDRLRAHLLDWLVQVHYNYAFMPQTLYLTINIVDRYLSLTSVAVTELRLLGITALHISSKYEELLSISVDDMIAISGSKYSSDQILDMEKAILSRLGWCLTVPTPYVFSVLYAEASLPFNKQMEDLVFYFTELGLLDYKVTLRNTLSKLAASAVYAARCTLNKTPAWTETLKHYTGYSQGQLKNCAKSLLTLYARASENKLSAVYKKYINPDRSSVSLCRPATSLVVANRHKAVVQMRGLIRKSITSVYGGCYY